MEMYYSKAPSYTVLQGSQINPSSRFDYLLKRTELGVDHLQHGTPSKAVGKMIDSIEYPIKSAFLLYFLWV